MASSLEDTLIPKAWKHGRPTIKPRRNNRTTIRVMIRRRRSCSKKFWLVYCLPWVAANIRNVAIASKDNVCQKERTGELRLAILVAPSKHRLPPNDGRHDKAICKWSKSQKTIRPLKRTVYLKKEVPKSPPSADRGFTSWGPPRTWLEPFPWWLLPETWSCRLALFLGELRSKGSGLRACRPSFGPSCDGK